jgi:hypothetical protein
VLGRRRNSARRDRGAARRPSPPPPPAAPWPAPAWSCSALPSSARTPWSCARSRQNSAAAPPRPTPPWPARSPTWRSPGCYRRPPR